MPEPTLTFKCLDVTRRNDGLIQKYHLEVTDDQNGHIEEISVDPRVFASAKRMKKILLEKGMLYVATREEHDHVLLQVVHS
ncbi:hypothetical protein GIB19_12545 [Pseudomonas sp. ITEM 17296]|uniref:hypothetical protein n=1 Tax=Pseudomonas sp. ITEM 17296 TaxID=2790281 RepID=UPI002380BF68|nr:hypothetical protein [Pseudomonas sp. ITEM 17296]MDE4538047.1 hypothetical protein [Pseudomonas sp. ITEM 17296]